MWFIIFFVTSKNDFSFLKIKPYFKGQFMYNFHKNLFKMIYFLFFINYFQSKDVNTKLPVLLFPPFGLKAGGTFSVQIHNCASKKLFIGLSVDEQIDKLWDSKFDYGKVCKPNALNFSLVNTTIKIDPIRGNVFNQEFKYSNVVHPIFIMCDTNYTILNATIIFKNPNSYLDSRYSLIYVTSAFHGFAYLATLFFLIIPIMSKAIVFMKFHIYLSIVIFVLFLEKFFELFYFMQSSKQPEISYFFYIHYAINVLSTGLLFAAVTLACGGWQIHTIRFGLVSFLVSLFAGFCTGGTEIFPVLVLYMEPDFITYLIQLFSFIAFAKVSVVELRTCEQYLQSYVLVVDTVGIDSKTTPVHRRIIMQNVLLGVLFIYFLVRVFLIHIPLYFPHLSLWIFYIMRNALSNLLVISLTINYMPWKIDKESWFATFDDEDKLADCAMEDFNPEGYSPLERPQNWKSGDKLPLPPLIAVSEYRLQSLDITDKEMPLIDKQSI